MTIGDAMLALNLTVSYATVRRLATSGAVKATKVMGRILLDEASFKEYLTTQGYQVIARKTVKYRKR